MSEPELTHQAAARQKDGFKTAGDEHQARAAACWGTAPSRKDGNVMTRHGGTLPRLSVVIPVYNSALDLERCLPALAASEYKPYEVIVVDDASTDNSADVARRSGATVLCMERNSGPAIARNTGARYASGDVLVFIDADAEPHPETLGAIARRFAEDSTLDAVWGSYDDAPSAPGLVAQFRNLLHHFTHQEAPRNANTFWSGCGAIRKTVFHEFGGFDEDYPVPSIEDVELGMRLAGAGRHVELDPAIQVKHRKAWTLRSFLQTDVLRRAVPFGELIARERKYPKVLGVRVLVSVALLGMAAFWAAESLYYALIAGLLAYVFLNRKFLHFLARRSPALSLAGVALLLLHHSCGAIGVLAGAMRELARTLLPRPVVLAVLAMLAVGGWQTLTVNVNYQGNWTALFCTGSAVSLPESFGAETYRFASSRGYDGQQYRLVAHDPLMSSGLAEYADSPAVRWRRILVPAVAWVLGVGEGNRIDFAYPVVILLFVGVGVYAMALWLKSQHRHPAIALSFVLFPGTLVCVDRMTVDVALYALLFLCLLWDGEGKRAHVWVALALCGLVRDLGFLVIGAFAASEVIARQWRRAAWYACAAAPAVAWYLTVGRLLDSSPGQEVSPVIARWAFHDFGLGILMRMLNPLHYDLGVMKTAAATLLDEIAWAGLIAALLWTMLRFRWRKAEKVDWVAVAFVALFFASSNFTFWSDLFSWTRAFTPLLVALPLAGGGARSVLWLPFAAVTMRVGLQFGTQVEGVVRAIAG